MAVNTISLGWSNLIFIRNGKKVRTAMASCKLMTPLFYNGNFNREGRRIRAVLEKEISDGTQTYRLWRSAGKPTVDYPQAENDRYILRVEVNGYLASLGMTDFNLVANCGFEPAAQKLYGGKEKRVAWINSLQKSGGNDAVCAAIEEERREIIQFGGDPARQVGYIQNLLSDHVSAYLKSKETGGQTFPDFIGALVMNELARCVELSAVYRAKQQAKHEAYQVHRAAEDKAYCDEQNKKAQQTVSQALQTIREGGVLKNTRVTFYHTRYDTHSYFIVNYLMRQYQIDVPLRTQGWITERLSSITIWGGRCGGICYLRSKHGRPSKTFYKYMDALIQAVTAQAADEAV